MSGPAQLPSSDEATVRECLAHGTLEIDGRVLPASNATFVGETTLAGRSLRCVYKPVRGERPLWDFPSGTLAAREVAAYEVSHRVGWDVVPTTVLGDGPFGPGMVQEWLQGDEDDDDLVDLVPEGEVPDGWLHVLDAWDAEERPVSLVHADLPALRRMAVFDVVINNADRKAGHLLPAAGTVHGCDHGLSFHVDDKLRTVLWGWAGDRLEDGDLEPARRLLACLDEDRRSRLGALLADLLSADEIGRLRYRLRELTRTRRFPLPPRSWRAVPWPIF